MIKYVKSLHLNAKLLGIGSIYHQKMTIKPLMLNSAIYHNAYCNKVPVLLKTCLFIFDHCMQVKNTAINAL